ncbi:GntR family transcriptional regulator [Caldalkalibacillus uzonensis]|uniref:GntR family transcriptional regulator n=1 Tax=Caldalkalibacillus uzonensis TaxID=353224 RepID=A0ABU0CWC6_9BACI|nr:GntR family transcriptional regulator [Caldalkalibacillus uzonensis]MDQ0340723.1 GntR family transcriptional regulator [Caldalkalibacillus uzonensis]
MGYEFDKTKPIYLQLVERICWRIVRQELAAGEKLPSVREMAVQSGVNPNTVQRTYAELERMGVTETRRGQGTFVTTDTEHLANLRETLKTSHMMQFVKKMRAMGFTNSEILSGVQTALDSVVEEDGKEERYDV